jgi:FLVCR family MFS transporter 7
MNFFKNQMKSKDSDSSASFVSQQTSSQNSTSAQVNNTQASNLTTTTPFWKLSSGKNGEKYLIFPTDLHRNYSGESSSAINSSDTTDQVRTFKTRWFILGVICLVNLSNAINWISYSPIADLTSKFYNVDYQYVNYLSLVYMVISIPAGFASFLAIDYFGIKFSINLAGWLNFIGACVRVLSSIDQADGKPLVLVEYRYATLMVGQVVCALAQPFIMFVTTKFANSWFSKDQRALANTLALSSNTFGILLGALISPFIVDSSFDFVSEMTFLNFITAAVSLSAVIIASFIGSSKPPVPPSLSASKNNTNETLRINEKTLLVFKQIGQLMRSLSFVILCVCFGLGLGSFSAITTLIQQIVCVRGYTDDDAGIFGGAFILSGIIGSLIFGLIADKTKKFEEISKICFCFSTVATILFVILQQYNNDDGSLKYSTLLSFAMMGFFGFSLLPYVSCLVPDMDS